VDLNYERGCELMWDTSAMFIFFVFAITITCLKQNIFID